MQPAITKGEMSRPPERNVQSPSPRLAVRAVIVQDNCVLLVNAFAGRRGDLWCLPGGGVERGASLPYNLAREVFEETGMGITVGPPCLVNEFHNPDDGFHQVEVFFRCTVIDGRLDDTWRDPEGIVVERRFFSADDLATIRFKPDSLPDVAFRRGFGYDPLERLVLPR